MEKIFDGDRDAQLSALAWFDDAARGLELSQQFLDVVSDIQPFRLAYDARRKQRRTSRRIHAALQGAFGLVVGVIFVELMGDWLGTWSGQLLGNQDHWSRVLEFWTPWLFAVIAWVLMDYWADPALREWTRRRGEEMLLAELKTVRLAYLALVGLAPRGSEDPVWNEGWERI